jgi:predicted nuclease with RNAse H fold
VTCLFAGIDLSARRGLDVAILDDERRVVDLWRVPGPDALAERLDRYGETVVAAVDAPQALTTFPLRRPEVRAALAVAPAANQYRRHRVCDFELARRGIPLYLLPEPGTTAPDWMLAGFATFDLLRRCAGLRLPTACDDHAAGLLEVYPFATFVTLLGGRPPRKTTPAGRAVRVGALVAAGVAKLPRRDLGHDAVDALAAAYTAWAWRHGLGSAVGLADDGLIVLPVPAAGLRSTYRPLAVQRSS